MEGVVLHIVVVVTVAWPHKEIVVAMVHLLKDKVVEGAGTDVEPLVVEHPVEHPVGHPMKHLVKSRRPGSLLTMSTLQAPKSSGWPHVPI